MLNLALFFFLFLKPDFALWSAAERPSDHMTSISPRCEVTLTRYEEDLNDFFILGGAGCFTGSGPRGPTPGSSPYPRALLISKVNQAVAL